jgi:hypothetical protein
MCAAKIAEYLAEKHGSESKVVMIGFQPAIAYHMSKTFRNFRITDMDRNNIGKTSQGILVESFERNQNAIEGADLAGRPVSSTDRSTTSETGHALNLYTSSG